MSVVELSAALRKKDSEKTQVLSEIRSLEELKTKGYCGRLQGKLVNVQILSKNEVENNASLSYTLSPPESGEEDVRLFLFDTDVVEFPHSFLHLLFVSIQSVRWINLNC